MQLYFSAHWTCSLLLHTRVLWTLLCAGSLSLSAYRVLVNLLTETDAIRPITSTTLSLSLPLASGLYWVAITVYDLQMQHSSCAVLRLFAPFQWLFAERGKSYASECTQYTPHTHTNTLTHSDIDTLMHVWWVCVGDGRSPPPFWRWQSSSHECALVRPQRLV